MYGYKKTSLISKSVSASYNLITEVISVFGECYIVLFDTMKTQRRGRRIALLRHNRSARRG
jgi:hypothetical protein